MIIATVCLETIHCPILPVYLDLYLNVNGVKRLVTKIRKQIICFLPDFNQCSVCL